jgi:hypothetical protein
MNKTVTSRIEQRMKASTVTFVDGSEVAVDAVVTAGESPPPLLSGPPAR